MNKFVMPAAWMTGAYSSAAQSAKDPQHFRSVTLHMAPIWTDRSDARWMYVEQAMADLENINAHLFSIEALMERIFDVRVPEQVEQTFREVAGELAPDPLNADRLRLNRLLHQTPDLPDHRG